MASLGVVHTGTPGGANGSGTDVRATLAGDVNFTTHWTVHPIVTLGSAQYWVCEHTNGHQVLFSVNTSGESAMYLRFSAFANTAITVWLALDANGGGLGSNSFVDNLYNNGLYPSDLGFWNQTHKTPAARAVEWFTGVGTCSLYFVWDDSDGRLLVFSNGNGTGRLNSISVVLVSDQFVDSSGRPPEDRILRNPGLLAVQADTDAGGNDVIRWAQSTFLDAGSIFEDLTTDINLMWWIGTQSSSGDPDSSGRYLAQTIGAFSGLLRPHAGIINSSLALFRPFGIAPNGQMREGGAYIAACGEMFWAWHAPLGDILL